MTNLARRPDGLTDEVVISCPDIRSTGFSGGGGGKVRIGDTVAIFAQGPIGLCATAGARLMGATTIIAIESIPARMAIAREMPDHLVDFSTSDPVEKIMRLTGGRGVDVAIEALRVLRPGGKLSSLGGRSVDPRLPRAPLLSGLGPGP